jgi:hypothetical protein
MIKFTRYIISSFYFYVYGIFYIKRRIKRTVYLKELAFISKIISVYIIYLLPFL